MKNVWKVKEVIKIIEKDDWFLSGQEGSHRQYKHPVKKGKVTVPGKLSDNVARKTFNSILRQAGLKEI
ncbi:MAG TPA: addiction module toxin, HicA family [Cyanobacteria bacterium UBA9971]|nr:addiction module toxin, HicA family [Cyanobacteria bacterium UBA9971]